MPYLSDSFEATRAAVRLSEVTGSLMNKQPEKIARESLGVPPRPVLWTIDQIATLSGMSIDTVKVRLFYDGKSSGVRHRKQMVARNIAPENEPADWRIAEQEMFRWLRICGFRVHERGWIRD